MVTINDCALIESMNPATERLFGYMPLAEQPKLRFAVGTFDTWPQLRGRAPRRGTASANEIYSALTARTVASIGAMTRIHGGLVPASRQAGVREVMSENVLKGTSATTVSASSVTGIVAVRCAASKETIWQWRSASPTASRLCGSGVGVKLMLR
jgi:hypothetical protein